MDHPSLVDSVTPPKEKDPVCGMDVSPATARFKTEHKGKQYFFCSGGCLAKFQAGPEAILSAPPKPMGSGFVALGALGGTQKPATQIAATPEIS